MKDNLNDYMITNADGPNQALKDFSDESHDRRITAHFRNLDQRLIEHIRKADAVLGCVAWLTHAGILDALAETEAAIVVQKEDFLRPDGQTNRSAFKDMLRRKYGALKNNLSRFSFGETVLHGMSCGSSPEVEAVRCVGNMNTDRDPAFPRMHNKFMVFCEVIEGDEDYQWYPLVKPYAVWTGSFNFTKNATASFENALYITDPVIVNAYYQEWAQITALSEPLDWFSDWCAPEWRIGT